MLVCERKKREKKQTKRKKNKNMSVNEAKSIEINETDCDNPISLDEIEKGLWLGWFLQLFFFGPFFFFHLHDTVIHL